MPPNIVSRALKAAASTTMAYDTLAFATNSRNFACGQDT